jgi:RimJ/RimL family protein N-acetyltransferase
MGAHILPETAEKYFLLSRRLGFREWTEADFPLAKTLWGNLKVTELIDARGQLSDHQVHDKLSQELANAKYWAIQYWPVFLLASDEFVGCCGFRPYPHRADTLELGFHICQEYWGNGYAAEAAITAMYHAFRRLEAQALFAGHNPKNDASRTLLKKLGFRYTHDEFYAPTGLYHPSYILTRDDYRCNSRK